tara:strand:+ start:251 stop:475 length:225 start_codon:yes stop_codon:yes gene_type:complete
MKADEFLESMSWNHDIQFNVIGGVDVVSADKAREYANLKVIEELEDALDMIQCSENLDSLREYITSKIELKQER